MAYGIALDVWSPTMTDFSIGADELEEGLGVLQSCSLGLVSYLLDWRCFDANPVRARRMGVPFRRVNTSRSHLVFRNPGNGTATL